MELDVRAYPLLALLALLPGVAFASGRSLLAILSLVSVLLIAGSLYLMFGIHESREGESTA
ncbi:hypothetical protein Hrd1104_06455 [Halorhabdus sp. CBA1104]|jgi:hypothetical protein|uniref:hypothetical protein n=1 Tax=Halorhabdus sp. CBA1104 TaxID=1380432 RepID=UPI0012B2F0E7|nr:hypothetical protein [Halorhabdus sp. CBA1104]QGN06969.1 hypothetical protein Hrd1104_06455 [Halorhabdus sp. CBA1104]